MAEYQRATYWLVIFTFWLFFLFPASLTNEVQLATEESGGGGATTWENSYI